MYFPAGCSAAACLLGKINQFASSIELALQQSGDQVRSPQKMYSPAGRNASACLLGKINLCASFIEMARQQFGDQVRSPQRVGGHGVRPPRKTRQPRTRKTR